MVWIPNMEKGNLQNYSQEYCFRRSEVTVKNYVKSGFKNYHDFAMHMINKTNK